MGDNCIRLTGSEIYDSSNEWLRAPAANARLWEESEGERIRYLHWRKSQARRVLEETIRMIKVTSRKDGRSNETSKEPATSMSKVYRKIEKHRTTLVEIAVRIPFFWLPTGVMLRKRGWTVILCEIAKVEVLKTVGTAMETARNRILIVAILKYAILLGFVRKKLVLSKHPSK